MSTATRSIASHQRLSFMSTATRSIASYQRLSFMSTATRSIASYQRLSFKSTATRSIASYQRLSFKSTATRSIASYDWRNQHLPTGHRSHPQILIPNHVLRFPTSKHGCSFSENKRLYLFDPNRRVHTGLSSKMNMNDSNNDQPGSPVVPPQPPSSTWKNRVQSKLSVLLPAWKNKWEKLLTFEGELEMAADMVAGVVEDAEEIIEALENKLPDGGKLKNAALAVENAGNEIVKDAHLVKDFIHKLEEVEREVETIVEPITDQAKDMDN